MFWKGLARGQNKIRERNAICEGLWTKDYLRILRIWRTLARQRLNIVASTIEMLTESNKIRLNAEIESQCVPTKY